MIVLDGAASTRILNMSVHQAKPKITTGGKATIEVKSVSGVMFIKIFACFLPQHIFNLNVRTVR